MGQVQAVQGTQDQHAAMYYNRKFTSPEADNDEVQMVARALAIGDRARHIVLDEDDEEEKKMAMPLRRSTRL